jgi:aminotransferase
MPARKFVPGRLRDDPDMKTDKKLIRVFGSGLGPEELEELRDCLDRQWIGMGPKTAELETQLAAHLGVDDFVLLNSGSNALHMAVHLLGLSAGSEIILPSFTWASCASAAVMCGLRPVFCDVDIATMNLNASTVERAIGPNTAAIMAVHYAGLPVKIDELTQFGVPIIEDAAHAIDSQLNGRACGTIGDIGVFSFDSIKNLAMGEGGGLVARDQKCLRRARDLRLCGVTNTGLVASQARDRWWEHEILEAFPKMTPSDLSAAVGLAQLKKLAAAQARRSEIWRTYQRKLGGLDWMDTPPDVHTGDHHSYFTYCVRVKGGNRDLLARYLLDQGIYTTLRFHPLHLSPVYGSAANLPVTETLMRSALNLPLHPLLSESDVDRIIEAIRHFPG